MTECPHDDCSRQFDSERGLRVHIQQTHEQDRPWTDAETLRRLYQDQEMNQYEIANRFDVTPSTISTWMSKLGVESRSRSEAKLNERPEEPWRDEDTLHQLYHEDGLSIREIAEELGCNSTIVRRWMRRFGIERRGRLEAIWKGPAPFCTDSRGYEVWKGTDGFSLGVHRLVAIADGADPEVVFGGGHHVHHKNEISWDNRPANLEVLEIGEHRSLHAKKLFEEDENRFS